MRYLFQFTMFKFTMRAAILLLVACSAHAMTASEIYEHVSLSTVVVVSLDDKDNILATGSGVVLPEGNVVTNCHVIEGGSQFKVRIGGNEYPSLLHHSDWDRDVCSLSVAGLKAPAVVTGSSKTLKVGARVYAVGAPKGLDLTLSDGIVSRLREVAGDRYIQTTAAISSGSSGGGLFDENGALVGLISFYLADAESLNFAIPVEWVKELAKRSAEVMAVDQPVNQWLNKAVELENRKDWPAMLEHNLLWTKAQPGSAMAWYSLGIAYSKSGQSAKAIKSYQQALLINPGHAEAWFNVGMVYSKAGQSANAIEADRQSLRINPDDAEAWFNLGAAYAALGQRKKVLEIYKRLKTLDLVVAERYFTNVLNP